MSVPTRKGSKLVPKKGNAVTALGYPKWGPVDRLNNRPGVITLVTTKSGVRLIEVDQTLTQGMSGGPVIDAADGVIGIIHKGGPGQGRDFAIHIQALNDWLKGEAAATAGSGA